VKFIKWHEQKNNNEGVSIVWNNKANAYEVVSGDAIGTVMFKTHDEIQEYLEKGFSTDVLAQMKLAGYDLNKIDLSHWLVTENSGHFPGNFYEKRVAYHEEKNELPYGVFNMRQGSHGETFFKPYIKNHDKLKLIKNKNLKETVLNFFNNKIDTGRKDKLGMLLYGAPGNGKTTEIMELFDICEENKLRIFIIDSGFRLSLFEEVRSLLSKDNCIFVLEEVTERLGRGVEEILTFLDGENSWTNSITIATTNYPEELPANLVDRPGRFELFIEYTNPTKAEILELAKAFDVQEDDAACLVGQGLSFDYTSFILSQAKKTGKSVKETKEFEENKRKRLSQTFKGKMGI
jgi:ATPase family protein associated with various cellular activities (AAA)